MCTCWMMCVFLYACYVEYTKIFLSWEHTYMPFFPLERTIFVLSWDDTYMPIFVLAVGSVTVYFLGYRVSSTIYKSSVIIYIYTHMHTYTHTCALIYEFWMLALHDMYMYVYDMYICIYIYTYKSTYTQYVHFGCLLLGYHSEHAHSYMHFGCLLHMIYIHM
jgi:hypothetical protein